MESAVNSLTDVMSVISGALLVPVLVAVLVCLACVLVALGNLLRDLTGRASRRRILSTLASCCDDSSKPVEEIWKRMQSADHPLLASLVRQLPSRPANSEVIRKRLTDLESAFADQLARLSFLTRVGPMLGLLGTLIPLGPALAGLKTGNMQQLSGGLVVAFAATVVGLVASCLSYGLGLVHRSWSGRDLDELDYIVNRLYPVRLEHAAEAKVGP